LIAKKQNLYYFETSHALEESWAKAKKNDFIETKGKRFYFLEEKRLFEDGLLCSPLFAGFIAKRKIEKLAKQRKGIILAGSPRTLPEAKELMPLIIKLYGIKKILILEIKLSEKESIRRNSKRRICSQCRHPVPFTPETKNLRRCPICGGKLIIRVIDKEETIKVRLKEYKERTYPLFKYFKKINLVIKEVDGEQSIENVFKNILKVIKND